jgi:hypothetical protein
MSPATADPAMPDGKDERGDSVAWVAHGAHTIAAMLRVARIRSQSAKGACWSFSFLVPRMVPQQRLGTEPPITSR